MKLRDTILAENSKKQWMKVVTWVGSDKERFAELMQLMLHDEYRVAQRAAYSLSFCVQEHPELIKPWFGKMIRRMQEKNVHDAVRRNSLRILEYIDVPARYCGLLFDLCNKYLHDLDQPIAVRAFSLTVMSNIAQKYPDLKNEVRLNAESLLHCGIPALESRSRACFRSLVK